jgi:hypothetical protein
VVDSASTVRPRVVRSRLGTTAAGVDGGPRRGAGAGRGGSHGWRRRSPRSGPGGPPLMERAGETPYACRPQPDQIFRDCNSLPAERRQTSAAGKPPLMAGSMGTYAEFVIAVADLEHCRYSALACPACSIGSNVAKYSIRSR